MRAHFGEIDGRALGAFQFGVLVQVMFGALVEVLVTVRARCGVGDVASAFLQD